MSYLRIRSRSYEDMPMEIAPRITLTFSTNVNVNIFISPRSNIWFPYKFKYSFVCLAVLETIYCFGVCVTTTVCTNGLGVKYSYVNKQQL